MIKRLARFAGIFVLSALILGTLVPVAGASDGLFQEVLYGKYYPGDEIIELRTENSKTRWLGGAEYTTTISVGAIHYKDNYSDPNELWKDIDLSFVNNQITKAPYILTVYPNKYSFTMYDKKTGSVVNLALSTVGGKPISKIAKRISKGKVSFNNVMPDVDVEIVASNNKVQFKRILKSDKAPTDAVFSLAQDGDGIRVTSEARYTNTYPGDTAIPLMASVDNGFLQEAVDKTKVKRYPVEIDPTATLQPSDKDSFMTNSAATANYGNWTDVYVEGSTTNITRALVQFDISSLPGGATLSSATFSLYYHAFVVADPAGRTYNCYRVLRRDWVEAKVTWNIYKTGSNWTTSGCNNDGNDYTTTDGASATVPALNNWMSWNVLAQVQTAYTGSFDAAFRISDSVENAVTRFIANFYSREEAVQTTLRPKLVVVYTVPPAVTTSAATSVEETTAQLNGEVTAVNDTNIIERGFVWDTLSHGNPGDIDPSTPTDYPNYHTDAGSWGVGVFNYNGATFAKGELYYVRACAKNDLGTWAYGSEVTFLTKPDAPSGFTATANGLGRNDLAWTKGTGAQKTYIRGKIGAYPTGVGDPTTYDGSVVYNDTGTSYNHTGLTPGDVWYYRTWSYATEGALERWSDLYVQDNETVLGPPTITVQAAASVEETSATLNGNITDVGIGNCDHRGFVWDTLTHVQPSYLTAPAGSGYATYNDAAGSFGTGAYTYSGGVFTKGTYYYVRSWAHNADGYGYSASEINFLTKPDPASGLSITVISSTQLNLAWTKGDGADRTMVRRKAGATAPTSITDGTLVYFGVGVGYGDTGLDVGGQYSYSFWSEVTSGALTQYSDTYISGTGTTTGTATYLGNFHYYIPVTITSTCSTAQELRIPFIINSDGLADGGYVQPDFDDVVLARVATLMPLTVTDISAETLYKSSEATANGLVTTLIDSTLSQADDYWNTCTLGITETTDELAPQGETSTVSDYDFATHTLTFGALTAITNDGDLYTVGNYRSKYFTQMELAAYQQVDLRLYLGYPAEGAAEREFCTAEADAVTVSDHADFDITDLLTVTATVKVFDLPSAEKKLVFKDGAYELGIDATNKPYFKIWHAGPTTVTVTATPALIEDTVYVLKGTYDDAANTVKLWVNDASYANESDMGGAVSTSVNDIILMDIDNCEADDIKIGHINLTTPTYVLDLRMEATHIGQSSILDQSAGSHNAAVTWDISLPSCIEVEVGGIVEVTTWGSPGSTEVSEIEVFELPTEPTSWMPTKTDFTAMPVYALIHAAGVQLGYSDATMYRIMVLFTAIGVGAAIGVATASALLTAIAVGIVLAVGAGAGIIGFWVILVYGIFAMGYIVASRSM